MSPEQWFEVVNEVVALWGRSSKWAQADELVRRVQSVPKAAAMRVIEDALLDGAPHAPPPAEVIGKAKQALAESAGSDQARLDAECQALGHKWATWRERLNPYTDEPPAYGEPVVLRCVRCGHDPSPDQADLAGITERIAP